jgi:hypothetical protein
MGILRVGKSTVGAATPAPGENPITVDVNRPKGLIVESIFGVLYLAARKLR